MADARVDILLQLRSQLDGLTQGRAALGSFAGELRQTEQAAATSTRRIDSDFDSLARSLRRKFSGVKLGEALLGGLGIGSSLAVVNLAVDRWVAIWREAEEHAKKMEERAKSIAAAMQSLTAARYGNYLSQQSPEEQLRLRRAELAALERAAAAQGNAATTALSGMQWIQSTNPGGVSNLSTRVRAFAGETFGGQSGLGGRDFYDEMERRHDAALLRQTTLLKEAEDLRKTVLALEQQLTKAAADATKASTDAHHKQVAETLDARIRALRASLSADEQQFEQDLKRITDANQQAAREADKKNDQLEREAELYRNLAEPLRSYRLQIEAIDRLLRRGRLTPEEAAAATAAVSAQGQQAGLDWFFGDADKSSTTMRGGPLAPAPEEIAAATAEFQRMQDAVSRVERGISGGLATALRGLADGTMEATDAAWTVFDAFTNSVLTAFTDMAAEAIVRETGVFTLKKSLAAADVALVAATETTKTGIKATSAAANTTMVAGEAAATTAATAPAGVLHSIMQLGPIAGPLAFAGAIAAMMALVATLTRREFGGPVAAGTPYLVGEKRPEVFVPTVPGVILPSVSSYAATVAGTAAAALSGGRGDSRGSAPRGTRLLLVDDMRQAKRALMSDPEFDDHIISLVGRRRFDIPGLSA